MDIRALLLDRQWLIEVFVVVNYGGLVADIYLAHSTNRFRVAAEYIPLYFSMAAAALLAAGLVLRPRAPAIWRYTGHAVGWAGIAVGLAGVILHLDSRFFYERTIRSLTYAAPFAAPLAYTGLGLLLIANRMVAPRTREWSQWVLLLALGGFLGNFVFSLTDHAQNGFFRQVEWVPVVSSACAVGVLLVPFLVDVTAPYLRLCWAVLGVQALVGVAGALLHLTADAGHASTTVLDKIVSGAPPMAPLLFVNLSMLAAIALAGWFDDRASPLAPPASRLAPPASRLAP
jgi:hypothetical protein